MEHQISRCTSFAAIENQYGVPRPHVSARCLPLCIGPLTRRRYGLQVHKALQRIRERKLVNFIPWGPASIQVRRASNHIHQESE
jgi:hypothetical protein